MQTIEVLELISVLGIHACNLGVPILAEELKQMRKVPARRVTSVRTRHSRLPQQGE